MWSRRQLLTAMGASGASIALGGWLGGCAGPTIQRSGQGKVASRASDLAPIFELLDESIDEAFVWSRDRTRQRVSKDSEEERFDLERSEAVVLGGRGRSVALWNASPEALVAAAQQFVSEDKKRQRRASPGERTPSLPALQQLLPTLARDPANEPQAAMRKPTTDLFSAAQGHGGSRIVYRNSYLIAGDDTTRFLSREHNLQRREVRLRLGVLFAAWTGDEVVTSVAERAGSGGFPLVGPSEVDLRESAAAALAHVHARSAPSGAQDVILSPECGGLVALQAIAKPTFALGQRSIPQGPLRVQNDPTLEGGYGSYARDDRGQVPKVQPLFGNASAAALEAGSMRRDAQLRLQASPANLVVDAGEASDEELVAEVMEGVYLEGPLHCSVDPAGTKMALLCSRGREIRNGRFTGRLYSRILASADCQRFFDDTRAVGRSLRTQAFEHSDVAISVRSPAWLSRAEVHGA